jgi:para-nitrobenzyl esterase
MQGYETIETTLGKIRGFSHDGVTSFLGVRYAEPPVADLRFKPPVAKAAWSGVADALAFGSPSMQIDTRLDARSQERKSIMRKMYPKGGNPLEGYTPSEDCLFLNIWVPESAKDKKLPVMVWLHGGGWAQGSGSIGLYEGDNLAALGDVVVVTVTHRLGLFGYLPLSLEAGDEFAGSENAGSLDILEALRYVKANIAAFGGDPENVTVFGQSGGGGKVATLMAMPAAEGLFHKGIMMSGPMIELASPAKVKKLQERLFELAGTRDPKEIQALSAERLDELTYELSVSTGNMMSLDPKPGEGGLLTFMPSVDGHHIPAHPFTPSAHAFVDDVPLLVGYTTHDPSFLLIDDPGWSGLSYEGVKKWCSKLYPSNGDKIYERYLENAPAGESPQLMASRLMSDAIFGYGAIVIADKKSEQSAPVFSYEFAYQADYYPGLLGASHSLDLPFVFYNVERSPFSGTDPRRVEVSRNMALAWTNFAHTGNPSHKAIPAWEAYDPESRKTMIIDTEFKLVQGKAQNELPSASLF